MPQKKHKPEEIVAKLRKVDVLVSQGQSVAEVPALITGYRPPAPEAVQWPASPSGAASLATPAVAPRPVMR